TIAGASAILPVADCASENATSHVDSPIASGSALSGTERTRSSFRTWKGKTIELKSPSTHSTSAPAGTAAATTLAMTEVCEPVATREGSIPTSDAYDDRDASRMGP